MTAVPRRRRTVQPVDVLEATTDGLVDCSPSPIQAIERELRACNSDGYNLLGEARGLAMALSILKRITVEEALSTYV